VPKLSDKKRCSLRIELEELQAIIIDEISMVSNKLMLYIHQRLLDIFGYSGRFTKPFAGITVILVGDLHQLPPVLTDPYMLIIMMKYITYIIYGRFLKCVNLQKL